MCAWMRILAVSVAIGVGGVWPASAVPTFFVDDTLPPSITNDVAWQSNFTSFSETDLDGRATGNLSSLTLGGVNISFSLPNLGVSNALVFSGSFTGAPGGQYGTVFDNTIATCTAPCTPGVGRDTAITLSFSQPVYGFGAWIFDDGVSSIDSIQMMANGATSGILDANPGVSAHIVEGFIGVVDPAGISTITLLNTNTNGHPFELDHLQLAGSPPFSPNPVPVPSAFGLLSLGLVALGFARRNWR